MHNALFFVAFVTGCGFLLPATIQGAGTYSHNYECSVPGAVLYERPFGQAERLTLTLENGQTCLVGPYSRSTIVDIVPTALGTLWFMFHNVNGTLGSDNVYVVPSDQALQRDLQWGPIVRRSCTIVGNATDETHYRFALKCGDVLPTSTDPQPLPPDGN